MRDLLHNLKNNTKTALFSDKGCVSYQSLATKAFALHSVVHKIEDEKAAVLLPSNGDYISAVYGMMMSGLTVMPLNCSLTHYEITNLLIQAHVRTVVSSAHFNALLADVRQSIPSLQIVYMEELPPYTNDMIIKPKETNPDEPMMLLATSGTTAQSKIVQLSENNLATSVAGYLDCLHLPPDKKNVRFVLFSPFSTAYGALIISACLKEEIPLVLTGENFTLDSFFRLVEKFRVTHYEGGVIIPLLMEKMLGRSIPYNLESLRYIACSGSKIPVSVLQSLASTYPSIEIQQGYGMTEAGPLIAKHHSICKPIEKLDSVGKAIMGVEIAIETNGIIHRTPNMQGEVLASGKSIMRGYYNNEKETERILKNGYLYTGDIGYLDDEGYLYLCGRKKNIIIIRGLNVYPEEVEECILSTDMAKDCIVYGTSDQWGNEIICADIVPNYSHVTKGDISAHCAAHLAAYKRPRQINIVTKIEKVSFGKTQRNIKGSTAHE